VQRSSIWKVVGVAGIAGVAATGVVVARAERQRRSLTPDDVRTRLRARVASIEAAPTSEGEPGPAGEVRRRSVLGSRLRSWRDRRLKGWARRG